MRITEVEDVQVNVPKLIALANFLIGRADDTGAQKKFSLDGFLNLAHNMGIGISEENLRNLASQGILQSVIANVTPNEVIFVGADDITGNLQAKADQSQSIVKQMAKRAM
jgi:hypothetical protein